VAVASSTSTPFDSDTSGPITHHVTGALSRPEITSVAMRVRVRWCVRVRVRDRLVGWFRALRRWGDERRGARASGRGRILGSARFITANRRNAFESTTNPVPQNNAS